MGSTGLLSGGHFLKAIQVALLGGGVTYREEELEANRFLGKFLNYSFKTTVQTQEQTKQQPKKAEAFANEF